jgi:hypothetical protein
VARRLVAEVVREARDRSQAQGLPTLPDALVHDAIAKALLDKTRSLGTALEHSNPSINLLNQVIADKERLELGPHPEAPIFGMKFNAALNAARDSGRLTQRQFDFIKGLPEGMAAPTAREAEQGITISTLERDAITFVEELKANMPSILSGAQTESGDFTTAVTEVFRSEPIEDIAQGRSLLPSFGETDAEVRAGQQAEAFTELFERPNLKKAVDALIDANPELQLNPLTATKDERDADQRLRARALQIAENLQGQNTSAEDIQAAISEMLEGADFVSARDALVANAEQVRTEEAVPTTVAGFTSLVKDALAQQGVFDLEQEAMNRLGLRAFQAGEVTRDIVSQGVADFRIQSQQETRETAFGETRRLTTSEGNLNAFVLDRLRQEGVFSRTSSDAFQQSIQQDILPGVAAEVAQILEEQPFSDPDAAFDTAFGRLSERRDAASTFGIGLSERDFNRQRGIGGIDLPVRVRPPEPLFTPEEEQTAFDTSFGDDVGLRNFALSRRDQIRERFGVERERRDRLFRGEQEAFSETVGDLTQQRDVGTPFGRGVSNPERRGLELVESGAVPLRAFAPTRPEPLAFGKFFEGQVGALTEEFSRTPEAERRRRRRLRTGGRTTFARPAFG